jgi:hypothetical protein
VVSGHTPWSELRRARLSEVPLIDVAVWWDTAPDPLMISHWTAVLAVPSVNDVLAEGMVGGIFGPAYAGQLPTVTEARMNDGELPEGDWIVVSRHWHSPQHVDIYVLPQYMKRESSEKKDA